MNGSVLLPDLVLTPCGKRKSFIVPRFMNIEIHLHEPAFLRIARTIDRYGEKEDAIAVVSGKRLHYCVWRFDRSGVFTFRGKITRYGTIPPSPRISISQKISLR